MNLIDTTTAPTVAPAAAVTDTAAPPPEPPDPQLRIDGEQADRLLRSSRWLQ